MVKVAHILVLLKQKASDAEQKAAQEKIDSIYKVLKHGGDFAELAKKYSQDPGSAKNGGDLGSWITRNQTVKAFEDAAYGLKKKGQYTKPIQSEFGYHIILLKDKQNFFPYDSVKADIHRFIDSRGIREKIIDDKLDSIVKTMPAGTTREVVLDKKTDELASNDPNLKYLVQEYHDGLLLYEISNREVWDKGAKDEKGQEAYFKLNRKNIIGISLASRVLPIM